ncbi:MAG TPA: hypothetical protein VK453_13105 [Micromonosporaceae bacterium]|nr:hypothetical protein [Micromonosporaceae bacterium]
MSTILMPGEPEIDIEPQARMLTIAANLLPPELIEARQSRTLRRLVVTGLAGFVGVLAVAYGVAAVTTSVARSNLEDSQSQAQTLTQQQRDFDDVVRVQAESAAIRGQLATLLANDMQWAPFLTSLQVAAPRGVRVTTVTGALVPPPAAPAPDPAATDAAARAGTVAAPPPKSAALKVIGKLTISGNGTTKADVAAYIDALGKVPGVANPILGSATLLEGAYGFTILLDITNAVLDGRFTPKTTTKPGQK